MPDPTRVLHIAAGNLYGGVETFLATLARYRERVPQLQSEFALCFEGRLSSELRKESAVVHQLGNVRLSDPSSIVKANLALAGILNRDRYTAVVMHGAWPHVVFGLQVKLGRSKLVTWAHGAPLKVGLLDRLADRIRPDLMIVNSRHTAAALGPLFSGVKSRIIYYPVEPSSPGRGRSEIRQEFGASDATFAIAFAGRFERWKGHGLLLRAASALLAKAPEGWCIWMCGGVQRKSEQAYADELMEYADSHGLKSRVKFLGQRSDVADVLRAADVFCQPNTGPEPFGIVFVEALYGGLPVVSTRMGGAAEIVTEACGILTDAEPASVADALHRLLIDADLRSALASNAPQRARSLCDPQRRINDIAAAIADLDRGCATV